MIPLPQLLEYWYYVYSLTIIHRSGTVLPVSRENTLVREDGAGYLFPFRLVVIF